MPELNPHIMDKECAHPGCPAAFRDHAWGATKAHKDGWFHGKDGNSFCPEHVPEWVEAWRARRKKLTSE